MGEKSIELFIKTPARKRYGCDLCGYDHPTEKFVGYNGTELWFGSPCLEKLKSKKIIKYTKKELRELIIWHKRYIKTTLPQFKVKQ